ncbi:MAG: hypothetical protein H0W72_13295 [Planctomycetes bacterium]|nr:hypothetical protein [Planctomycetota bacterium]
MNRMLPSLALVAATAVGATAAQDPNHGFLDLRLGYTFLDKSYEATVDDGITQDEFDNDWDEQHRAFGLVVYGFPASPAGGFMIGADVTVDYRDDDPRGTAVDLSYESYGAHAHVGYYLPIGNAFQVELLPFVGFAAAKFEHTIPGNTETSSNATLIEFGVNLNAILTLGRFQIGGQAGYLRQDSDENLKDGADNSSYDFGPGNLLFSAMIGVRI